MSSPRIQIFDPAMCCSTGVCGPEIDPKLIRFAADVEWLVEQGVPVARFNLAQNPGEFVAATVVKEALEALGEAALPMVLLDGRTVMSGAYPTRDQLGGWVGVKAAAREKIATSSCCSPKTGCC
jgi:hypothetical protein